MQFSLKLLVPEMKGWPKNGSTNRQMGPAEQARIDQTLSNQALSEFAKRRHEAVKAQILYGGLR
jgi:hypothetical protein